MTIKEITQLRKSGQLEEALKAAEQEYELSPNEYTASALFWCLNDQQKPLATEAAAPIVERMLDIYHTHCEGDEFMEHTLHSLQKKVLPMHSNIQAALEKAKAGQNVRAEYAEIAKLAAAGELDDALKGDFGWLVYYVLKHTPVTDPQARKILLSDYLKLKLPAPSILHSLILQEAIKIEKNTPLMFRLRDFVRLWGIDNLRDEDWEQFSTDDGNTLPCTVERLIGLYARELKTDGAFATEEMSQLADQAIARFPKNQNLPYYKAVMLLSQGRKDEAVEYYRKLILRFPSKFYLWSQMAELVADPDTRIGLLTKALMAGTDDKYTGAIRLALAQALIDKGMLPQAALQLSKYKDTYTREGWGLKPEFWHLVGQTQGAAPAPDERDLQSRFGQLAEQFVYQALPSALAIKESESMTDDRKRPGKKIPMWRLLTESDKLYLKKPAKFGLGRCLNGTIFEVKVLDGKIVWIKPAQVNPLSLTWIKKLEGELAPRTDRKGNPYAIVGGAYVPASLMRNLRPGQRVKIIAVKKPDGRWNAIALAPA